VHVCASESYAEARMKWQSLDADFWRPEAVSHKRRQWSKAGMACQIESERTQLIGAHLSEPNFRSCPGSDDRRRAAIRGSQVSLVPSAIAARSRAIVAS